MILQGAYPKWDSAFNSLNPSSRDFVIVPLSKKGNEGRIKTKLLVTRDNAGLLKGVFVMYYADDAYHTRTNGNYNTQDFCGVALYTDLNGQFLYGYKIENGQIFAPAFAGKHSILGQTNSQSQDNGASLRSCGIKMTTAIVCDSDGRVAVDDCHVVLVYTYTCLDISPSRPDAVIFAGNANNNWNGSGSTGTSYTNNWNNTQPTNLFSDLQLNQMRTLFYANGLEYLFELLKSTDQQQLRLANNFIKSNNATAIAALKKYTDEEFTFYEFRDFFQNSQNFNIINDFLQTYNFSVDAKKIAKVHSYAFKNDSDYANETLLEGKLPAPLVAWILKASGETIIDLGIDAVFGYLTGEPPGFWNAALTFGSNLIGTGELTQAGKIAKYTAKITELAERVKLLRGGITLAQNIKTKADRLLVVLKEAAELPNPSDYLNKVHFAFSEITGALYEARIATAIGAIGGVIKGVGLRNLDLADNIGLSLTQLTDFAARKGFNHVNDIEIDILEDLGGGLLSLTETKTAEKLNSRFFDQFDKYVDLAVERFNLTQQNTIVTYYFRYLSDAEKSNLVSRAAQKGVTLRIFIQQ